MTKEYKHQTEKQLLYRCRRGDTFAFDEIVCRSGEYIYSWILSKENNYHKAEDIYQRTLIKSWKAIKKFKGGSSYSTWANAIARNLVIDDYKKKMRNKEDYYEDIPENKRPQDDVYINPTPLERICEEERSFATEDVLAELSAKHRIILKFYYKDELSYKEISIAMDCSIGTVMSRLFYAKKNMLRLLKSEKNLKKIML